MLDFAAGFPAARPALAMAQKQDPLTYASTKMRPLPHLIFASRWLQLPLYLGLIVAQLTFLLSALAIAAVDRLMPQGPGRMPARMSADTAAH